MSYEYRLVFEDPAAARNVMEMAGASPACVRRAGGDVHLKDPATNSRAEYDVRLTLDGETSLWLQVNFRCPELSALMQGALSDRRFRCLEDGDEACEVTLDEAFRIGRPL